MIKIKYVEDVEIETSEHNSGINFYEYEGNYAWGSLYGEEYTIKQTDLLTKEITDKISLEEFDIDIHVIPMKLRQKFDDTLGSSYFGQAFYDDNLIFDGAVGKEEDLWQAEETFIHEIGHFVTNRYIIAYPKKYKAFKELIGRSDDNGLWHNRPSEFLAEYFVEIIKPNSHMDVEFIPEAFEWLKQILPLKEDQPMEDNNIPSEWAKEYWEQAIKDRVTDGTRPHDNITREEAIVMMYRMENKDEKK